MEVRKIHIYWMQYAPKWAVDAEAERVRNKILKKTFAEKIGVPYQKYLEVTTGQTCDVGGKIRMAACKALGLTQYLCSDSADVPTPPDWAMPVRLEMTKQRKGLKEVSIAIGYNPGYVGAILAGRRFDRSGIVKKAVCNYLGLTEFLEEQEVSDDVQPESSNDNGRERDVASAAG